MLDALRTADWLTAARARAWCRVLAAASALAAAAYLATARGGVDWLGRPLGTDFVSFWTAGRLALAGHPAAAYDPALHAAAQRALFPRAGPGYYAFFYPPPFLLLCRWLAALPYMVALTVWLALGVVAFALCLRSLLPLRWARLPILACPGMLIDAGHGQTALLAAACLGWSMVLARRRPFLAGVCLGVLVIKPQLLLAAPVALAAARRWRMAAGGGAAAAGLCLLSWGLLWSDTWRAFVGVLPLMRATLRQGLVEPWKMASTFAAVRLLHGSVPLGYVAQAVAGAFACLLVAARVRHRPGALAEGAMLVPATLLCTPFLLDYDLACLALPAAWVAAQASRTGWRAWEKTTLLAAYVLPLAARPVAMCTGVSLAPAVMVCLLLVAAARGGGGASTPGSCSRNGSDCTG